MFTYLSPVCLLLSWIISPLLLFSTVWKLYGSLTRNVLIIYVSRYADNAVHLTMEFNNILKAATVI